MSVLWVSGGVSGGLRGARKLFDALYDERGIGRFEVVAQQICLLMKNRTIYSLRAHTSQSSYELDDFPVEGIRVVLHHGVPSFWDEHEREY